MGQEKRVYKVHQRLPTKRETTEKQLVANVVEELFEPLVSA